jgi:AcrR family transcriptional regulator
MTAKKSPELRKEEIFNAALICFIQKGYYETSIDAIAAKAGITKGGLYHHFASKKTLFIELFQTFVNRYFETLRQRIHHPADVTLQIQDLIAKSEEIFSESRDILKFCFEFMSLASRDSEIRAEVNTFYKNRVSIFAQTLTEGIISGRLKKIPADDVARTLYFLSMGFFLTYFTVDIDFDPMTQHAINLGTFMDGIKETPQRSGCETAAVGNYK